MTKKCKTPLRYAGGKSRAMEFLLSEGNMPQRTIKEYREPFIGGGSPAIAFAKKNPTVPIWINDKYYNLYCFWLSLRDHGHKMHDVVMQFRKDYDTVELIRPQFYILKDEISIQKDPFEIAWRFFVINRCSFSGLTENSSFSEMSSVTNFNENLIANLRYYNHLIKDWKITNLDYKEVLKDSTEDTFIFLDPPYDLKKDYTLSGASGDKLYGKGGNMHKGFDHLDLTISLNNNKGMHMVTYNSNPYINSLFMGWRRVEWELTYSMNNGNEKYQEAQKDRKELLCTNYELYKPHSLEDFFS